MKYIIYCRKSTDTEDKQVMSLDSQENELLLIAEKYNLKVVKTLRESMSAKSAGRPIFEEMVKMISTGKADAILCWKLDRLARNFIDGGLIMDMLQKNIIQEIRTHDAIHLPKETSFILAMQFGMANQYSRDLSENVKRGNREKLARGEWPNHAPFGYLNDKATKTIVIDPVRSKYVVRAFNLYITGSYGFQVISNMLYEEGLRTRSNGKVLKSHIQRILGEVFYTGLMEREGKFYQGIHQPLITKEVFDKAQDVMHNRIHPKPQKLFFPLRGFLTCDNCGCALTASIKKGHHYYYCTNGKQKCEEHKSYMRENYLYEKVSELFDRLDFTKRKINLMYRAAKEMAEKNDNYSENILNTLKSQLGTLKTKENRLLDTFLAEQISKDIYDAKVLEIHNERVSLNQKIRETEANGMKGVSTLEPVKEIFLQGSRAKKEFLKANDRKKREIIENLLWNLSFRDKNVAEIRFKSTFEILAKTPKNASINTLLRDLDSNQDNKLQRLVSYH